MWAFFRRFDICHKEPKYSENPKNENSLCCNFYKKKNLSRNRLKMTTKICLTFIDIWYFKCAQNRGSLDSNCRNFIRLSEKYKIDWLKILLWIEKIYKNKVCTYFCQTSVTKKYFRNINFTWNVSTHYIKIVKGQDSQEKSTMNIKIQMKNPSVEMKEDNIIGMWVS